MGVKHLKKRQSMLHDEKELLLRQFRKVIKFGGPGHRDNRTRELAMSRDRGQQCKFKMVA